MRAREFVRETAVGHILTPRFEIVVDDHALERARERGVDPRAVDYIIRTQLPKVSHKLDQIEVNQKFWVYDWSRELALGLRRLSSTEPRFLLKTVWPGRPARTPEAEQIVSINESVGADQVLDYVKRTHAPEEFDIEYSITDHPEWELKTIPLSQLNLDPDGEAPDPYNRVNWVDDDKVQELIPRIESVLKSNPIVVDPEGWIIDGNHRAMAAVEAGMDSVPAYVPVKQGVTEGESNDTAISLSKLGKFHPGADTLAQFVPERTTAQYALHPDKWESTFYSLTNKDSDKLKYYGPKKISIPPGTLVGDMAIANKFYRAKTSEEKQQYAELYKASLQPYPVDVSEYRMPELLIPKQGVAENFADGKNPGRKGLAKRSGVNTKASVSSLRKTAKNSSGEKQRMAHWLANMKAGRAKARRK